MSLAEQQKRLKLSLIDYDLDGMWEAHPLIGRLRERITPLLPKGLYDAQDLEHQVLFRLTTFDPKDITDEIIRRVIAEQYLLVRDRLDKLDFDLEYLFRGFSGKHRDLNVNERLTMSKEGERLVARNRNRSFGVEFRLVEDERVVSLFTSELHYMHKGRPKGETFGLYFAGDDIPWAVETTEPSVVAKPYKRDALLANGIDPNKAVELTRFYTLPGAPANAISLMDGLVSRYYKPKGIEALFTTTMPMYSKTKGSTVAGNLNKVLLVKDLRHRFVQEKIGGEICYRHATGDVGAGAGLIETHPNFPTMLVVEVYGLINEPSLRPLEVLRGGSRVIYARHRDRETEKEVKFAVKDISSVLDSIRKAAAFSRVEYLRDVIYGAEGDKRKIRVRMRDDFENASVEAMYKYKVDSEDGRLKTEIEEIVYKGESAVEASAAVGRLGDFKEENSYEKVRAIYRAEGAEITLDVYPYGVWVEVEGEPEAIWRVADELGFRKEDAVIENADELYVGWQKRLGLKEQWDVRFGLSGNK